MQPSNPINADRTAIDTWSLKDTYRFEGTLKELKSLIEKGIEEFGEDTPCQIAEFKCDRRHGAYLRLELTMCDTIKNVIKSVLDEHNDLELLRWYKPWSECTYHQKVKFLTELGHEDKINLVER